MLSAVRGEGKVSDEGKGRRGEGGRRRELKEYGCQNDENINLQKNV